ncbi:MAG: VWA domain-containing protein [Calditrichaeota bacterium]|nr:VWA domain-containing protein [Calditrichota bacterium]
MTRHRIIGIFALLILLCYGGMAQQSNGGKIQVALLLDTSNSMDGLIEQAKSQLWKVVNEFALARQNGQPPALEIALYEYGNDNLSSGEGYIRMVTPLTTDLDRISEDLFGLTTNGGNEYCGWVIRSAVKDLKWDSGANELKVIFIAGNEPFSQGSVDFQASCRDAIGRSIIVNTIFCGDHEEGIRTDWKKGADLADGKYMNIDQDEAVVHIDAPQDAQINRLNEQLNDTYIPFGSAGLARRERQLAQDRNAAGYGAANLSQRAVAKSASSYKSADWDLVDALDEGEVNLDDLQEDQLPEKMQKMSPAERKQFIADQKKRREKIQQQIQTLSKERRQYVETKRRELSDSNTLDDAIIRTVREQAARKQYRFD